MKDTPLISICIPTYNAEEFLEECLDSAVSQIYPHTEILICDDGSTDATLDIIKKYQQQFNQIRLVENKANKGMVNNWNRCIEHAKGEWIKYLFQDDVLDKECITEMLKACEENDVEVALCKREFIIHDNISPRLRYDFTHVIQKPEKIFGEVNFIPAPILAQAVVKNLFQNILGEPTCYLFKKSILESTTHYNLHMRQMVDYEFIVRLGLIKGLAFLPKTLAKFRLHGKSESSANNRLDEETQLRNIAAVSGDAIMLLYSFLKHPTYAPIREIMDEKLLKNFIKHIYYSGCKHNNRKIFDKALRPVLNEHEELAKLKYNFFKYSYYRRLIRKWKKKNAMP